ETWAKNQKPVAIEFVVSAPKETPADQPLFLSGNDAAMGVWDGAGVRMEKRDDGKYHASVDLMSGIDHAFKVTRGTWGTVERAADITRTGLSTDKINGGGDQYAKFVVEEVKPQIDKLYRTQPDRAHTALAGSSMGGLITLYMAKVNHDTFAQIAVMTPWLREG